MSSRQALRGGRVPNPGFPRLPMRPGRNGSDGLEGQGDALPAPDAQRDHATTHAVAMHGVDKTRRQHSAGCADRVTMRDGTAFDIDDVLGETELLGNGKGYGRERFVDLEALHVAEPPACARERLLDSRNRTQTEQAGLNSGDAVCDEAHHRPDGPGVCKGTVGDDHGGGGAVETWCIAGGDGAAFAEGGTELSETVERRVGPRRLIRDERLDALFAPNLDRDDLLDKLALVPRLAETPLRAFGKTVLCLARELRLRDEIFRVPARVLA